MVDIVTIKYNGLYQEIPVGNLDLNPDNPSDEDIKLAMSRHLEIEHLNEFLVEPEQDDENRASATVIHLFADPTFANKIS